MPVYMYHGTVSLVPQSLEGMDQMGGRSIVTAYEAHGAERAHRSVTVGVTWDTQELLHVTG